jgi:hypothetical protein
MSSTYHIWYIVHVLAPEARTLLEADGAMPELHGAWNQWFLRLDDAVSSAFPLQVDRKEGEVATRIRRETEAVLRHAAGEEINLAHLPEDHPDFPLPF